MAISNPDEVRVFAGKLSTFADQLEALAEQTTRGLSTISGWQDDAFDEFEAGLNAAIDPIRGFAGEGKEFAARLQERAALVDRVAAHGTSAGAAAALGATAAGAVGPLGAAAGGGASAGSAPVQPGGGRYRPGTGAVPAGGRLSGFGDAVAYKTSSGGAAFLRSDDKAAGNALRVQPFGQCRDFMMHGYVNKDGSSANCVAIPRSNGTTAQLNAQQFARFLESANGGKKLTQPVRLCSCMTGADRHGFAAQLARELGVPVVAPAQSIWFDSEGRTLWSAPLGVNNRATWRVFAPDGRAWQAPDWATGSRAGWDPI